MTDRGGRSEAIAGALPSATHANGEASPIGRWVRISGRDGVVYVIQDAWGEGCLLMEIDKAENRQTEHFLSPELALVAAARATGHAESAKSGRQSVGRLAEAG